MSEGGEDTGGVTGPFAEAQERGEEAARTDFSVAGANHRVKTGHGTLHLDAGEPGAEASVTVSADHERLHDKPPMSLHVKTTDMGLMEGLTCVDMTVEEAIDLRDRLNRAIVAAQQGDKYYER